MTGGSAFVHGDAIANPPPEIAQEDGGEEPGVDYQEVPKFSHAEVLYQRPSAAASATCLAKTGGVTCALGVDPLGSV